jgi:hypothetical protein
VGLSLSCAVNISTTFVILCNARNPVNNFYMPGFSFFYFLEHGAKALFLMAPVVLFAICAARAVVRKAETPKRVAVGILAAFALVVSASGFLGMIGELSLTGFAFALWIPAILTTGVEKKRRELTEPSALETEEEAPFSRTVIIVGLIGLALTAGHLAAKISQPTVEYDELTYHLHFPTQWLLEKRIFIIDTPFGDAAPAYAPANGELWFAWLMAPMQGRVPDMGSFKFSGIEALAKVGQFPFIILLSCAVAMLIRRLGNGKGDYLPVALLPFIPWILRQSASAGVDLMMGACLVASVAFINEYKDNGRRADAAISGLSLGLAFGVKFVAIVYSLVIMIPMAVILIRRKDLKAFLLCLAPVIAFGLPWYIRNLIVCGNPLFPVEIAIGSWTIFPGAYTRAAMLSSVFHTPDFPSAIAVSTHAFGLALALIAIGSIIAGLIFMRRHPAWRYVAWIAPVAFAWHFLIVPYSSQDRFLIWAVALSFLALSRRPVRKTFQIALAIILSFGVFFSLFGAGFHIQTGRHAIHAMGFFELEEHRRWFAAFMTIAPALAVAAIFTRLTARRSFIIGVAFAASFLTALTVANSFRGHFVRTGIRNAEILPLNGYARVWELWPRNIAYAGKNMPFYLAGRDGTSRVHSINVDGRDEMLMHDYVRELSQKGLLDKSLEKDNWRRKEPNYEKWLAALGRKRIEYIFLQPRNTAPGDPIQTDKDGYTIERNWAKTHPDVFVKLKEESKLGSWSAFEVYAVRRDEADDAS